MEKERIYNNKSVKCLRKELRNNPTPTESALWELLRAGRLDGTKWRRQYSIGKYIVDFYCPKARLCIELDGDAHYSMQGDLYDFNRDEYINSLGIKTLSEISTLKTKPISSLKVFTKEDRTIFIEFVKILIKHKII